MTLYITRNSGCGNFLIYETAVRVGRMRRDATPVRVRRVLRPGACPGTTQPRRGGGPPHRLIRLMAQTNHWTFNIISVTDKTYPEEALSALKTTLFLLDFRAQIYTTFTYSEFH